MLKLSILPYCKPRNTLNSIFIGVAVSDLVPCCLHCLILPVLSSRISHYAPWGQMRNCSHLNSTLEEASNLGSLSLHPPLACRSWKPSLTVTAKGYHSAPEMTGFPFGQCFLSGSCLPDDSVRINVTMIFLVPECMSLTQITPNWELMTFAFSLHGKIAHLGPEWWRKGFCDTGCLRGWAGPSLGWKKIIGCC